MIPKGPSRVLAAATTFVLLALFGVTFAGTRTTAAATRPNIVLVNLDDATELMVDYLVPPDSKPSAKIVPGGRAPSSKAPTSQRAPTTRGPSRWSYAICAAFWS